MTSDNSGHLAFESLIESAWLGGQCMTRQFGDWDTRAESIRCGDCKRDHNCQQFGLLVVIGTFGSSGERCEYRMRLQFYMQSWASNSSAWWDPKTIGYRFDTSRSSIRSEHETRRKYSYLSVIESCNQDPAAISGGSDQVLDR